MLGTSRLWDVCSSWCHNVHVQLTDLCNGLIIGDLVVVLSCMVVPIRHSIVYCIYSTRFTLRQSSICPVFISHLSVWWHNLCDTLFLLLLIPCDLVTLTSTMTLQLWLQLQLQMQHRNYCNLVPGHHYNSAILCSCDQCTMHVTPNTTIKGHLRPYSHPLLLQLHEWP